MEPTFEETMALAQKVLDTADIIGDEPKLFDLDFNDGEDCGCDGDTSIKSLFEDIETKTAHVAADGTDDLEYKIGHVRNAAFWGAPVGTPLPLPASFRGGGGSKPRTPSTRVTRSSNAGGRSAAASHFESPIKNKSPVKVPTPPSIAAGKPKSNDNSKPGGKVKVIDLEPHALSSKGRKDGAGTEDDPIDVEGDLDLAVKLLYEKKHIRLNTQMEVSTLIKRVKVIVDDAEAKGDKAPLYDLCKVSVPKTNLFCVEHKGIPRVKMPQFGSRDIVPGSYAHSKRKEPVGWTDKKGKTEEVNIQDEFQESLLKMGVKITDQNVTAAKLKATQSEVNGGKVAGMAQAMKDGKIDEKPIMVTRDGYIIDGHHRWAAKVAIDIEDGVTGDISMPVQVVDLDIGEAIDYANQFALANGLEPAEA